MNNGKDPISKKENLYKIKKLKLPQTQQLCRGE
jgi:hypothetical protein